MPTGKPRKRILINWTVYIKCGKCGEYKPETDEHFYWEKTRLNYRATCKPCSRKTFAKYDYERADRGGVYHLATKARNAVRGVVKAKRLVRISENTCCICNEAVAQQYHHHKGYNIEHWLDVIPVCITCHRKHESKESDPKAYEGKLL